MPDHTNIPLVIILGPTAVGKSELAFEIAQRFNLEIINADSMQVYRGMDIGSAKPSPNQRQLVPHHLIDVRNPDEDFSAAQFRKEASAKIIALAKEGKQALLVGGSGLYIRALTRGLFPAPPADAALRKKLKQEARNKGKWFLHKELEKVDPEAARRIHPNDTFRIIRALEVLYLTGKTISEHQVSHQFRDSFFHLLTIGLTRDRGEMYARIEQRVNKMISNGLLEEVKGLLARGYKPGIKPFQSLGYAQMLEYLQGEITFDEAVRLIKRNTKRYAKRQLTWFRKEKDIRWFLLPHQAPEVSEAIKKFLKI